MYNIIVSFSQTMPLSPTSPEDETPAVSAEISEKPSSAISSKVVFLATEARERVSASVGNATSQTDSTSGTVASSNQHAPESPSISEVSEEQGASEQEYQLEPLPEEPIDTELSRPSTDEILTNHLRDSVIHDSSLTEPASALRSPNRMGDDVISSEISSTAASPEVSRSTDGHRNSYALTGNSGSNSMPTITPKPTNAERSSPGVLDYMRGVLDYMRSPLLCRKAKWIDGYSRLREAPFRTSNGRFNPAWFFVPVDRVLRGAAHWLTASAAAGYAMTTNVVTSLLSLKDQVLMSTLSNLPNPLTRTENFLVASAAPLVATMPAAIVDLWSRFVLPRLYKKGMRKKLDARMHDLTHRVYFTGSDTELLDEKNTERIKAKFSAKEQQSDLPQNIVGLIRSEDWSDDLIHTLICHEASETLSSVQDHADEKRVDQQREPLFFDALHQSRVIEILTEHGNISPGSIPRHGSLLQYTEAIFVEFCQTCEELLVRHRKQQENPQHTKKPLSPEELDILHHFYIEHNDKQTPDPQSKVEALAKLWNAARKYAEYVRYRHQGSAIVPRMAQLAAGAVAAGPFGGIAAASAAIYGAALECKRRIQKPTGIRETSHGLQVDIVGSNMDFTGTIINPSLLDGTSDEVPKSATDPDSQYWKKMLANAIRSTETHASTPLDTAAELASVTTKALLGAKMLNKSCLSQNPETLFVSEDSETRRQFSLIQHEFAVLAHQRYASDRKNKTTRWEKVRNFANGAGTVAGKTAGVASNVLSTAGAVTSIALHSFKPALVLSGIGYAMSGVHALSYEVASDIVKFVPLFGNLLPTSPVQGLVSGIVIGSLRHLWKNYIVSKAAKAAAEKVVAKIDKH